MVHFACFNNENLFFQKNKKYIVSFYKYIIQNIINSDLSKYDKKLEECIYTLITLFERKVVQPNIVSVQSIWKNNYFMKLEISEEKANYYSKLLCLPYIRYHMDFKIFEKESKDLVFLYYKSYKKLGISAYNITLVGQEIIFPSEIICILNQFNINSDMVELINSIDFNKE